MRHDGVEFGQLVAVRFDEGQLVRGDVFLQINRGILGHAGEVADFVPDVGLLHVQALGNERGVGGHVAGGVAHHERGEGGVVIHDDAAFAVDDFAARSEDGHFAHAVVFGLRGVVVGLRNLEAPEPVAEHEEDDEDAVLHRGQASCRNFFFAAQHKVVSCQSSVASYDQK